MKTSKYISILIILAGLFTACYEETIEIPKVLDELKPTKYFDTEIFPEWDLKIYGTWKIFI